MEMDFAAVPTLVGDGPRERAMEILTILERSTLVPYLTGPSGASKTIVGMNVVKAYCERQTKRLRKQGVLTENQHVPGYYVQLSPDMSKSTLVMGWKLKGDGKGGTSLQVTLGVIAEAMQKGGCVFVDEAPHGVQELLLNLNSTMDRTSVTSVGDVVIYAADTFRMFFGGNTSEYAGNVRLPQSFANRLTGFYFDYPNYEDELAIAQRIAKDEYFGEYNLPDSVVRYVVSYVREIRTKDYPLSARNISSALIRLCMTPVDESKPVDPYFTSNGANVEATRKNIARRILGHDVDDTYALGDKRILEFIEFVSQIGVERFRDIIKGAVGYYLDIDGTELYSDTMKNQIASTIV